MIFIISLFAFILCFVFAPPLLYSKTNNFYICAALANVLSARMCVRCNTKNLRDMNLRPVYSWNVRATVNAPSKRRNRMRNTTKKQSNISSYSEFSSMRQICFMWNKAQQRNLCNFTLAAQFTPRGHHNIPRRRENPFWRNPTPFAAQETVSRETKR